VGRELEVLVEGVQTGAGAESAMTVGRSYRDAPEVDGLVFFKGEAKPGDMVRVRITSALEYDLVGELIGLSRATAA
jgi:ribosomal protein S12 methylthiotransferase